MPAFDVHWATAMPLRIVTKARAGSAENALVLDGWLSGPEVAEFERAAAVLSLPLRIDLAHVTGADAGGVAALHQQRARGAALANASPYIELLLRAHTATAEEARLDEASPRSERPGHPRAGRAQSPRRRT